MTTKTGARLSARERLLASASELFYTEGVHAVGIDRIIEHAGVAKATLYSTYGSKDELIRAYLRSRHEATRDRVARGLARYDSPRERLVGMFEVQAEQFGRPDFRGCAFASASAEASPWTSIDEVSREYRDWIRSLFTDLARDAGVADPSALAAQLVLLYDGAAISGRMDRGVGVGVAARCAAASLVAAALT
jgi:AcrR family transcriptional regulator